MVKIIILALTLLFLNTVQVFGHRGGTYKIGQLIGCHNNRKEGGFHCHSKSKYNGKSFKSEKEALQFVQSLSNQIKQKKSFQKNKYKYKYKDTGASFSRSKRLLKSIYSNGGTSFYCNEKFNSKFKFTSFEKYKPSSKYKDRIYRVEWEHIVPAENFGRSFIEWREGHKKCISKRGNVYKGRKCASKVSAKFRAMEADLVNLVPVIGQINALRSNYRYAEITGEEREFGNCDIKIKARKFEPPKHLRGDVSRTYRYMQKKYEIKIIGKQANRIFEKFEKEDPISKEECARVKLVSTDIGLYEGWCSSK